MASRALTIQQHRVLTCLRRLLAQRGFPPTLRELAGALGLAHVNAVRGHLLALERKGYIEKAPVKARSIRIVAEPSRLDRFRRRIREGLRPNRGILHHVVYGLAWTTRERRPVLVGDARAALLSDLEREAVRNAWAIISRRIGSDYVALVVKVGPQDSPRGVARRLRQRVLPGRYGRAAHGRWGRGYLITTSVETFDEAVREWLGREPSP